MIKSFLDWICWQIEQIRCSHPKWKKRNVDSGAWWYQCPKCLAITRNPKSKKNK